MTTKKDEPGKDSLRPSEIAGGKKPVPTLDLKATEVREAKVERPAPEAAEGTPEKGSGGQAGAESTKSAATASSSAKTSSNSPGSTAGSGAGGSTSKSSDPAGGASVPPGSGKGAAEKQSKQDAGGKPAGATASKERRGGGFLSHLAAGVVGGFLALLGADMIGPQIPPIADSLGLPSAAQRTSETTAEIERRLAALEESVKADDSRAGADVAARLDATDSRVAALEEMQQSIDTLQETQNELVQKATALDEKLQASGDDAAPDARIAKLEQQFEMLSESAGENGSPLPELARLTGRLSDLESTVSNQIAALRENVNQDVDGRIEKIAETSESARAAAQRIDRELASITTETARLAQRFEALKADDGRISETLRVLQEETGALRSQLEAFQGDVTQRLTKLTTAEEVKSAIQPVQDKISSLEKEVSGVLGAEQDRKANAQRIVLSLELGSLKRAVDRGEAYADELAQVRKVSTGLLDLAALEPYESAGVATLSDLQTSFRPVANDLLDAAAVPENGSVLDQLLAGAKSVVRIRKVSHDPSDHSVEAIVGRIEEALASGHLGDVLAETEKLPESARQRIGAWQQTVEARHAVDQALAQVEDQLKASLSGAPASSDANSN